MKVALSASGPDEGAEVDERFGRCPYFVIVDTEKMNYETWENEHTKESHGVGPQVVQTLSERDVDAVITGNVGPNAFKTLDSAGIDVYKGSGKISDMVERLKKDELEDMDGKTVQGHFGKGGKR